MTLIIDSGQFVEMTLIGTFDIIKPSNFNANFVFGQDVGLVLTHDANTSLMVRLDTILTSINSTFKAEDNYVHL